MTSSPDTYALICGGGTAGHVLPAIAIGHALVEAGHPAESLHFVGSIGRIEAQLVPEAGFTVTLLPGRGIQRKLTFANVDAVLGTIRAVFQAMRLVRRRRPRVVIAMGGYASVPCGLAAVLWRVPIVVAEQNAVPGAANRLIARFAKAAAVSFPGTPLPRAIVTGNPVRDDVRVAAAHRPAARAALGIDDGIRLVLVVGGSLGARRINQAVVAALPEWRGRRDIAVRHVIGARDWAEITAATPALGPDDVAYAPVEYEHAMPTALAAADIGVCRSGAGTCFELCSVGLPAILVPSPFVTGDHQTANARYLADHDAAVMVADAELDGPRLVAEIDALLADPSRRASMADHARALARPDAAAAIAALAEQHAR